MEGMKFAMERTTPREVLYIETMKTIYLWAPRMHTIYFGNVRDLVATKKMDATTPLFQQYPEYNKFPYRECIFEADGFGDTHTVGQYPARKRAIFASADENFAVLMLMHCVDADLESMSLIKGMWVLEPFVAILRIGTGDKINTGTYLDAIVKNKHAGKLLELDLGACITIPLISFVPDTSHDLWFEDGGPDITFLKYALLMLHCKNIVNEKVLPSEKLNKKRQKSGKLPFYTYHVLKVTLPGTVGGKREVALGTGIHQRLNFCMGHYKHYTAEKPLFGKLTGLWWWNDFARGSKELGIVEKEHHVTIKKDVP
jgi:hypothetical protein